MDDYRAGKRGGIVMVNGGKVLTRDQMNAFIEESKKTGEKKRANIGVVSDASAQRIRELTGIPVKTIILESDRVKHAYGKTAHNLESDDLTHMVDVINTTTDIELSPEDSHGSPVVIFRDDIHGEIYFLEGVHEKDGGFISLVTAYRKKKIRRGPDGKPVTLPGANVRNGAPLNLLSHNSTEMSSPLPVPRL